ncbi:unnamed protein product [Oikopleura dioica]|uniref:Uncharacterized protein n=1 Tax=Oikopleura dioica TaxID=34765 RepID=E4XRC4_OIKDI|nr:unnamed protein product [Oikopleura dioica]
MRTVQVLAAKLLCVRSQNAGSEEIGSYDARKEFKLEFSIDVF